VNSLSGQPRRFAKSIREGSIATAVLVAALIIAFAGLLAPCVLAQVPTGEKIITVEVEGLKTISQEAVMEAVKVKPGDLLTEEAVRADLEAISDTGLFFNVAARFYPHLGGIKLVYEVVENPRISSIGFKGNEAVSRDKLDLLMSVRPEEILNLKKLNGDLERILKYYYNEGYSAKIKDVNISDEGDVTIELVELRVADVRIEGHKKTKDYVIRRYITVEPGELLNVNKLREDQRKLGNLGIFESIDIKLDMAEAENAYIVTYVLKEARTGSAGIGAGYSSAEKFIGYIEVSESNFLGRLQTVNVNWQFGKGRSSYTLGFYDPWIDAKQTSFGINLYNRTQAVTRKWDPAKFQLKDETGTAPAEIRYDELRRGGNVSLGRPLRQNLRLSLSLRIDATDLVPLPQEDKGEAEWTWVPGKNPSGDTRSLTLSLTGDTRDHYMNPTKGFYWRASAETAGALLGGSYTFSKYQGEGSAYREVRPNQVFAVRLSGGTSTGVLPLHEQYRIGGAETLRGYNYGEFYGDSMLLANAEYRFQILKGLQGVVFVDTGSTWLKEEEINVGGFSTGAGLGVRVETPIGMLRIDYGIGKQGGQAYLSFGQMF
jgi:outer membrane protein insertion porin family